MPKQSGTTNAKKGAGGGGARAGKPLRRGLTEAALRKIRILASASAMDGPSKIELSHVYTTVLNKLVHDAYVMSDMRAANSSAAGIGIGDVKNAARLGFGIELIGYTNKSSRPTLKRAPRPAADE